MPNLHSPPIEQRNSCIEQRVWPPRKLPPPALNTQPHTIGKKPSGIREEQIVAEVWQPVTMVQGFQDLRKIKLC